MSNFNDNDTTIRLFVNGAQAQEELARLTKRADELREGLKAADEAGDLKKFKALSRDLDGVNRKINQSKSVMQGVGIVLDDLSGTSMTGLRNTLRHLQREIHATKPNTEQWQKYAEEIRTVKERIAELNGNLGVQPTLWGRIKTFADDVWPVFDLMSRGYDYVVSSMRKYVDAYAEMDQEMANVRKFTGMTEMQVHTLNEEFKKIDTRSSREQLNKLAQEAGRLGLSSSEEVLGFVRASDKINVALDELGDGATLTLSKLTDMFGDKERYGVEKSLLKTGSVINELSQSSSAAAPYLTEFAERLSGIGVQADISVAKIMGIGAVLDSNGHKVEAASTAISQILVRMMQDPAKYAEAAGLEVEHFTNLLRTDANEALLLLLKTLNQAGGLDVLAPMFKDMGENGSRAVTTLASLAKNVDLVRQRQAEATAAFAEGTSVDKEFAVQNGTVQASLEKARKAAEEIRIELGERLAPLAAHFMLSSSSVARALLDFAKYVEDNKGAIISLTAAVAAYIVITRLHALWLDRIAIKTLLAEKAATALTFTQKALSGLWASLKLGAAALTNGFLYLKNGLSVTYTMQERWRKSMQAMSFASWTGLILAVASAIYLLYQHTKKLAEETKVVDKIRKEAIARMGEEKSEIDLLVAAAQNENLSMDERQRAIEKLNSIIPGYNAQLDDTTGKYKASKEALDEYLKSLTRKYELEGAKDKLAEIGKEMAEATVEQKEAQQYYDRVKKQADSSSGYSYTTSWGMAGNTNVDVLSSAERALDEANNRLARIKAKEKRILDAYGEDLQKDAANNSDVPSSADTDQSSDDGNDNPNPDPTPIPNPLPDRFAQEKAWRTRQEAEARIAYAKGETAHAEHMESMSRIELDYYQKLLDRADLTSDERLSIEADYEEAAAKQRAAGGKAAIDEENRSYEELTLYLSDLYARRLSAQNLSEKERLQADRLYRETTEQAELNHLSRLVEMYEEGSEERLRAQLAYQSAQLEAQKRHQQEFEKQEAEYAKIKDDVFGDNPQQRQEKFDAAMDALQEVYEREIAAAGNNADEKLRIEEAFLQAQNRLRSEYAQEAEEDTRSSMERGVAAAAAWLKSEGGQALTGTLSTLTQGMASVFSGLSTMIQAELEIQTASINKKYEREVSLAQGNSYKVAQLEKKKETEIAKIKNEANRKLFAMQVIQAVAQTAQNALAAFGSAAQVPVVGHILAPIAAAMAIAAGGIQVAAIKKQQQAAEAQGYSRGGFTKPGAVDEPAGIVHAGEWVASQRLLANPVARPMIEALDYAQRTNTIGSLRPEDVSRSITANNSLVRIAESDNAMVAMAAVAARMTDAVSGLNDRLNEPFVTVNTASGDKGINAAQDEYARLMRNKSPKSRKKK